MSDLTEQQVLELVQEDPAKTNDVASCFFCCYTNDSPHEVVNHLESTHFFSIENPEAINDLPRYLRIYSKILTDKPSPFFLSTDLPNDDLIRKTINKDKLKVMLNLQHQERADDTTVRTCIFCRQEFTGDRSQVFQHMFTTHNLNLGRADGLVNVDKLLTILHSKMDALECLFCNRVFRNREALKNHMKKKNHIKVHPSDKLYDQFYIINYSNPGIGWQKLDKEVDDELYTSTAESLAESMIDNWSDWTDDFEQEVNCLYCDEVFPNVEKVLSHFKSVEDVDFINIVENCTLMEFVQLVNFLRICASKLRCPACNETFDCKADYQSHVINQGHQLPLENEHISPQYLIPFDSNDPLLFSLEGFKDDDLN
ncbi:hypothetical protein P9112_012070 [Eukaryota sp. TZLM1-RC]